jgi:hypothetical protein
LLRDRGKRGQIQATLFFCLVALVVARNDNRAPEGLEQTALGRRGTPERFDELGADWALRPVSALRVSSQTPSWLKELVSEARDEWAATDPRLFVPIVETLPGLENIHYQPTSDPSHVGETNLRSDGEPSIVIWPKHEDAYSVVLHELGHALCGCGVHLDDGVMRAKSNVTRQSVQNIDAEVIASRRVAYFRAR